MKMVKSVRSHDFTELWKQHSLLIVLVATAFAFDALSTIFFMTRDGIDFEFHPLVRYSALIWGPIAGTILSAFLYKIIVTIGLALYLKPFRFWVLTAPIIPAVIAGISNFYFCNS